MDGQELFGEQQIKIPHVSNHFCVRKEIFSLLDNAAQKLVIVHAGMGYGKTVMLSQYASQLSGPCAWYSIHEENGNLDGFLACLGHTLTAALPFALDLEKIRSPLYLARTIHAKKISKLTIILDHFDLADNREIHDYLRQFLDAAPSEVRLILSVKGALPAFCVRYLIEDRALLIGREELSFEKKDVKALIAGCTPPERLEETAEAVLSLTDRWPAAVSFLLLYYRERGLRMTPENLEQALQQSYLSEYFMDELYRPLPEDMQEFLKKISVFQTIEPEVCASLTGDADASEKIAMLVRENLFLCPAENGNGFQLQKPLRIFLMNLLRPEEKQLLYKKAESLMQGDLRRIEEKILPYTASESRLLPGPAEEKPADGRKIQVSCFGRLKVILPDGKILHWRTRKTQELFAYLFHVNGAYISREKLLDTLWPSSAETNAAALLHTSLYNIRKNLAPYGLEQLIEYDKEGYRMNMSLIESDREKMEQFCRGNLKSGMMLYQGDYLENVEAVWAEDSRAWYAGLFLNSVRSITKDLIRAGDNRSAVACLRAALRQEPYDEDLAASLIRCYTALGEVKNAMNFYKSLQETLRRDLDAEPSEEVVQAYKECLLHRLSSRRLNE